MAAMANGNGRRNRWSGFDLGGSSGEPRRLRTSPWVWVIGFLVVLVLFNYFAAPRPSKLDYSDFLHVLKRLPEDNRLVVNRAVSFVQAKLDRVFDAVPGELLAELFVLGAG